MSPPHGQPPAKGAPSAKSSTAGIRVCLDFIKGRCVRAHCRYHHPEMAQYQQVSNAVQASAGKQICEVWAMAGTCKFGSKCNKLHPVVITQPTQSILAVSVPTAVIPTVSQRPPSTVLPLRPPPPTAALFWSQPQPQPAPTAVAPAAAETEAEFEDLAQSILKALDAEEEWGPPSAPATPAAWPPSAWPYSPQVGRSLASLFGVDSFALDVLGDPDAVAC